MIVGVNVIIVCIEYKSRFREFVLVIMVDLDELYRCGSDFDRKGNEERRHWMK